MPTVKMGMSARMNWIYATLLDGNKHGRTEQLTASLGLRLLRAAPGATVWETMRIR